MTTYVYVLEVEKAFSGTELEDVKTEMCRLFDCTGIEASGAPGATDFTVHTPLTPEQADRALSELSEKFGARFRAGVKVK